MDKKFITDMNHKEAQNFLLKTTSYCNFNLPPYFDLGSLITSSKKHLLGKNGLKTMEECIHIEEKLENNIFNGETNNLKRKSKFYTKNVKLSDSFGVNFTFQKNKTTQTYRPMTILHPLIYVDLVALITKERNWNQLINRLNSLRESVSNNILCKSIPFDINESNEDLSKESALHFWSEIEQESLKMSLDYSYMLKVDISNCYGSIYTHSIAWAFMGEENAKRDKGKKSELGNLLDKKFQSINYGETVGIPQGNIISDIVAEIILAYIDNILFQNLEPNFSHYKILRYRDDYRIFANSENELRLIKKELISVLQRFKLSLGESKTLLINDVVLGSINDDKLFWLENDPVIKISTDPIYTNAKIFFKRFDSTDLLHNRIYKTTLQKHLFCIKQLAIKFPNSGQLKAAFIEFENRIKGLKISDLKYMGTDLEVIFAIVADIIYRNPKVTEQGVRLLSLILDKFSKSNHMDVIERKIELVSKLNKKILRESYNDFLEVWLHRLIVRDMLIWNINNKYYNANFSNSLTKLVEQVISGNEIESIFNEEWLEEKYRVNFKKFINVNKIRELPDILMTDEIILTYDY